jgi:hypothetical protein
MVRLCMLFAVLACLPSAITLLASGGGRAVSFGALPAVLDGGPLRKFIVGMLHGLVTACRALRTHVRPG